MSSVNVSVRSSPLPQWAPFLSLLEAFGRGQPRLLVEGLWGSSRALVTAALLGETDRPALVLVPGLSQLHRVCQDLAFFEAALRGEPSRAVEFPPAQPALWRSGSFREVDAERALVCFRLLKGEPLIVVTTPAALAPCLLPPEEFRGQAFRLAVGDEVGRERLVE